MPHEPNWGLPKLTWTARSCTIQATDCAISGSVPRLGKKGRAISGVNNQLKTAKQRPDGDCNALQPSS